jgi:hypothetical protein
VTVSAQPAYPAGHDIASRFEVRSSRRPGSCALTLRWARTCRAPGVAGDDSSRSCQEAITGLSALLCDTKGSFNQHREAKEGVQCREYSNPRCGPI